MKGGWLVSDLSSNGCVFAGRPGLLGKEHTAYYGVLHEPLLPGPLREREIAGLWVFPRLHCCHGVVGHGQERWSSFFLGLLSAHSPCFSAHSLSFSAHCPLGSSARVETALTGSLQRCRPVESNSPRSKQPRP